MLRTVSEWLINKISIWLTKNRSPKRAYLCDFNRIRQEVHLADVLLIEGRNHVSEVIKKVTQSPWSHATLYIGRFHDIDDPAVRERLKQHYDGPPEEQLIIESILGKGTIVSPLSKYKDDHIRICRPQGISRTDAHSVASFAVARLGIKYNIRHIFDLYRLLVPWSILPRTWRSTLFRAAPGMPTHDICSSMIAKAFASVHFPILPLIQQDEKERFSLIRRNPHLFTPSDFDYSPYFAIIKYPIFGLADHTLYRHLPWQNDVISHDKRGVEKAP